MSSPKACCLCSKPLASSKDSHNAEPLERGRCCDECHHMVITSRLLLSASPSNREARERLNFERLSSAADKLNDLMLGDGYDG